MPRGLGFVRLDQIRWFRFNFFSCKNLEVLLLELLRNLLQLGRREVVEIMLVIFSNDLS